MNENQTWRWLVCAAALAVTACQSAATRIYTLEAPVPATRLKAYEAPALRVDSLSVPAGWDRIEILRPSLDSQLRISDFDHWSAPLGQIARQALSADLSERLPPGSVIFPRLPKPGGALGIDVDILEFSLTGARASMRISWVITPGARRNEALLQQPMSSTEPADVAHAWSALLAQLADRIAADAAQYQAPN